MPLRDPGTFRVRDDYYDRSEVSDIVCQMTDVVLMPWDITQLTRRGKINCVVIDDTTLFTDEEVAKLISIVRQDPDQFLDRDTANHHYEPSPEEIADFCAVFRMFDPRPPVGQNDICLLNSKVKF